MPRLVGGRRAYPVLHGPAHGRPEFEPGDPRRHVGEVVGQPLLEHGLHPVAGFEVLGDDHRLGEEVVVELHIERQIEADSAAADIRGEPQDVGGACKHLLQPFRLRLGRRDRGVLRQGHGHEQLRPVRSREELLLHEAETVDGSAEGDE